jgi:hypothetical protein
MTKFEYIQRHRGVGVQQKIELEKSFVNDLRKYFSLVARDLNNFKFSIDSVLNKHYNKIESKLTEKHPNRKSDSVLWKIDHKLADYKKTRAAKQAHIIDKTTKKDIIAAKDAADQDTSGVNKTILASRIFKNISNSRLKSIAITETSGVYEKIKNTVVSVVHEEIGSSLYDPDYVHELSDFSDDWTSQEVADGVDEGENNHDLMSMLALAGKIWLSTGDEKVRESHQQMDGVEVGIMDFFTLPFGDLMQFPGDESMGADVSEIANCRCCCEYI